MRTLAWCALALAAACGTEPKSPPGPLDRIRMPTGMAVLDHRVLVASSNADLFYDTDTGGTVISLDAVTDPDVVVSIASALRVRSFAGELAIARTDDRFGAAPDAESCGTAIQGPLAVFGTRGSNTLDVLSIAPDGGLACRACDIPAEARFTDPFPVAIACGGGRARAYVGYLTAPGAEAVVSELDLTSFVPRTLVVGIGPVAAIAYDRDRDRIFLAGNATASPTPLRWVDLGGCTFDAAPGAGGCTVGSALLTTLPAGLELRSIALANPGTPGNPAVPGHPRDLGVPIRAYVTGRFYDTATAAAAGFRTTDYGGVILVLDLYDDGLGGVHPQVVWTVPIGKGARDIRVLPPRPGLRDAMVAVSVDEGVLTVYDDETRSVAMFRMDQATGAPVLGHQPFGLAVDPAPLGTIARVWVGSYMDSFVTPIDVPLAAPDSAVFAGPNPSEPLMITGATR